MRDLAFIQKQGFTMHEFILKEDRISVKSFSINEMKSRTILLDDLGHKTEIEKDSKWVGCGLSLLFFCFSIMFIIGNIATHSEQVSAWLWITISMFSALLSIFILTTPVKNEIRLVGGIESLVLLFDKPSEKEVRDFIDEIIGRSKRILLRKYGTIDPDLPEQVMISQLNWLFESEVITKDVFDELKSEYIKIK
jgi:hypothetical protein